MRVVLFGATGMIGKGVLIECLESDEVEAILAVGRTPSGLSHPKLREVRHDDFLDFSAIEGELGGLDACFWCLGVSSSGMSEADYTRVTFDYTAAAADALHRRSPGLVFCFVSGSGTDSSEAGRSMWARVKGRAENHLLGKGFSRAVMFRPGYIHPAKGTVSKTRLYRAIYRVTTPLFPAIRAAFPRAVTTTDTIGRAMIRAAADETVRGVLLAAEINRVGAPRPRGGVVGRDGAA